MGTLAEINESLLKHSIPFWKDLMTHGTYDAFWQARDVRRYMKNINPAVMTVGGWFDAEDLFGALETYRTVEKTSPGAFDILAIGPWYHGGWSSSDGASLGNVNFASKTSVFFREKIEYPFFEHFLKDAPDPKLPEAYVFETGTNQWHQFTEWPPANSKSEQLYLRRGAYFFTVEFAQGTPEFKDFGVSAKPSRPRGRPGPPRRRKSSADVFSLVGGLVCDFDDGGRGLDGEVAEGAGVE